jgi:hypothetical protein
MLFEPVDAIRAERPTTGLLASARTPTDNVRWETGISWRPERCPQARGLNPLCGIENPFESPELGTGETGLAYYSPVAFRVIDECTTRDNSGQFQDRVKRQADAVTSYMVAKELQDGAITRTRPYDTPDGTGVTNNYLASSLATVQGGTWEPNAGLGKIEELARATALGQDVFIHIPVHQVPLVRNALVQRGNLLYTKTGATVVADAGYTGTGPLSAGTSEVQTVTITGAPTGGTFTLTYAGQTTAPIPFNATAAQVEAALEALSNLDTDEVAVGGGPGPGTPWTVTFAAQLGNVGQMTANGSALTGGVTPAVGVTTTTPGVAPAATAGEWMYSTGPVTVRLAPIMASEIIDQRVNRRIWTADRLFAATFDPCNLHALQISVPATA